MSKLNLKQNLKAGIGGGLKAAPMQRDNPLISTVENRQSHVVSAPALQQDKKTKADIFTERVTLVISTDQRDMIEGLARKIQRNGIKKPERITANTVLRALVNLVETFEGDVSQITDEDDLNRILKDYFVKQE